MTETGYALFLPFALGALTAMALTIFALAKLAPWEPSHCQIQAMMPPIHPSAKAMGSVPAQPFPFGGTVMASGSLDYYSILLPVGTFVVESNGPTSVQIGVWSGNQPLQGNGLVRVCGASSWGRKTLAVATGGVIQVTNPDPGADTGPGQYEITIRRWDPWTDSFVMNPFWNLHPSSC